MELRTLTGANPPALLVLTVMAFLGGCASSQPQPQVPQNQYATTANDQNYGRPRDGTQNEEPPSAQVMEDGTERRVSAADAAAAQEYKRIQKGVKQQAYADGVRDTMEEFKMRMEGRQNFVWQQPIIDYVWVPGGISNGAFIPGHYEPVIYTPGDWSEENGIQVPVLTPPASTHVPPAGSRP
jgi:hypothetical protein